MYMAGQSFYMVFIYSLLSAQILKNVYLLHKYIPFLAKGNPVGVLRNGVRWFTRCYAFPLEQ